MDNLDEVISTLNRTGQRGEVWIDGSFLTEKLNPDDVDVVLVVKQQDFDAYSQGQLDAFEWFQSTSLYDRFRCDNYAITLDEARAEFAWIHAYWVRQFGFSRRDEMKGLAVVRLPFLVMP